MKTLIIYFSFHQGNTEKVAKAMAQELNAELVKMSDYKNQNLEEYDLIGLGAGVMAFKHHPKFLKFVKKLEGLKDKKVFVFSTSGEGTVAQHKTLNDILKEKGANIIDEFSCPGSSNWLFFKDKPGRPNQEDLEKAKKFAQGLENK